MWPRDAFVGQHVAALANLRFEGAVLERGKVYTIESIMPHPIHRAVLYFGLNGHGNIVTHFALVRPLDNSKLEVFRNVPHHKNVSREPALSGHG